MPIKHRTSLLTLTLASILASAVLLSPTVAHSQNPEWENFTSGANVYALADDGDYLWVGGGGLTRLNKATGEMTFYNRANSGLPNNIVSALSIDAQGNKWIGTLGGGLAKFDGTNWNVYNTDNSGLPSTWVQTLVIDAQGNTWIGTRPYWNGSTWVGGGLAKFDGTNWNVYNTGNSELPHNDVNALAVDAQENIWIGTLGGGLAKFDGTNWNVYNTDNSGLPSTWVQTLVIDAQGNTWIGTRPYWNGSTWVGGGLAKFDGTNWNVYNTGNSELPHNDVNALAVDAQGNKWIGTESGGLAQFDGANWIVYNTDNSGLPNNIVSALAIDAQGNIWIGTYGWGGGLAMFDGVNWTVYNTYNSGLPGNYVSALSIDAQGKKWIGTGDGLAEFDGVNWTVYNTYNSGLPGNYVSALSIDAQGNIWVGTMWGGLAEFDGVNWTVYNTDNSGLPSNDVRALVVDAQGNKWIGNYSWGGLAKFDGVNWIVYNTDNSGLPVNFVGALAIDAQGSKWIGTDGGGLAKFDGVNWTVYNTENSGLPSNRVGALAIDAQGNKWIGTGGGLAVYRFAPNILLSERSYDFGDVHIDSSSSWTVTISNTGNSGLSVADIASSSPEFTVSSRSFTVPAGESEDVTVIFRPTSIGPRTGTLTITSNDPDEPSLEVSLSGTGVDRIRPYTANHAPAPGETEVDVTSTIYVEVKDDHSGIDRSSIELTVSGGTIIFRGIDVSGGRSLLSEIDRGYSIVYDPLEDFEENRVIVVVVWVKDLAGNTFVYRYSFSTPDTQGPMVSVTSPNGGENWAVGSTQEITWTASDNVGVVSVDLFYSTDGGRTWLLIASGEKNDGSYSWKVPATPSTTAKVKVLARDAKENTGDDVSDGVFTISDKTPPTVRITSPNGGESWPCGSPRKIIWEASDNVRVDSIGVFYSLNAGFDWVKIVRLGGEKRSYVWAVPDEPSTIARMKVTAWDEVGNQGEDTSDGNFVILDRTAPEVTVLTPNGGEDWPAASTQEIRWMASDNVGIASIELWYSVDGGVQWKRIASMRKEDTGYAWEVPNIVSERCRVKIVVRDGSENEGMDISAGDFSISDKTPPTVELSAPNGDEAWKGGTTQEISWTASDNIGVTSIRLFYSTDGGASWSKITTVGGDQESYLWRVPEVISERVMVKVVALDQVKNQGEDKSDGVFSILDRTAPPAPVDLQADGDNPSPWKNTPDFSIDWTNPPDPSGIVGAWYKLGEAPIHLWDGTYTTNKPFAVAVTSQGEQVLYVWLQDGAGNRLHTNYATVALRYDSAAPSAPIALTASPSDWTRTNSFSLSWRNLSDASGIAGVYYKLDSPPQSNTDGTYISGDGITSIKDIKVSGEGAHKIYVWLKDKAGNVSYIRWASTTLRYDATAPLAPADLTADPSDWSPVNSFSLSWENPPELSGIAGAYYKLSSVPTSNDDGTFIPGSGITSITEIKVPDEGAHAIYVWLKDQAGNVDYNNRSSTILHYDVTSPLAPGGLMANGSNPSPWRNTPTFTVDWTNPADISGIAGAWYKLGTAPIHAEDGTYITDKPFTVTVGSEGGQMLYVWLQDSAGNRSRASYTIVILRYDATKPPAPSLISPANGSSTNDTTPTFDWEDVMEPIGSGVSNYVLVVDDNSDFNLPEYVDTTEVSTSTPVVDLAPGTYYWRVRAKDNAGNLSDWSEAWSFTIIGPLTSLSITPSDTTVASGVTVQYEATGFDAAGNDVAITPTWEVLEGVGTIDATGLFTAKVAGIGSVVVSVGATSDTASVAVTPGELASIDISPDSATVVSTATHQFSATGVDAAGNTVLVTPTWSVSDPELGTITADGLFTAKKVGVGYAIATQDGVSDSAFVRVTAGALASIEVIPEHTTVISGQTVQFTVEGFDEIGNSVPSRPFWSVLGGVGEIDSAGVFTGTKAGDGSVIARDDDVADTVSVKVTPGPLAFLDVSPDSVVVISGEMEQYIVVGSDSYGNRVSVDPTWSVVGDIGIIDANGLFTGTIAGDGWVEAAVDLIADSAYVKVVSGTLASILLSPSDTTVVSGDMVQFKAEGTDKAGNVVAIEPSWAVLGDVGEIDPSTGLLTATKAGTGSVVVSVGTISDTTSITVTASALASIDISPDSATVTSGEVWQFSAAGYDAVGNAVSITPTWSVSNAVLGTIDSTGLFTTNRVGTGYIIAAQDAISDSAVVKVIAGALASIEVSPSSVTIVSGEAQQFTAAGYDAAGNDVTITPTWEVLEGVGTINETGLFTATVANIGSVVASVGAISDTVSVTVTSGDLAYIDVSPDSATVASAVTHQFSATGADAAGNTVLPTPTWSVSDPELGMIDESGLFTAKKVGVGYVIATQNGVSDSTVVTVTPGASAFVTIADSTDMEVNPGAQVTVDVTVKDAFGNNAADGTVVVWDLIQTGTGAGISSGQTYTTGGRTSTILTTSIKAGNTAWITAT